MWLGRIFPVRFIKSAIEGGAGDAAIERCLFGKWMGRLARGGGFPAPSSAEV